MWAIAAEMTALGSAHSVIMSRPPIFGLAMKNQGWLTLPHAYVNDS